MIDPQVRRRPPAWVWAIVLGSAALVALLVVAFVGYVTPSDRTRFQVASEGMSCTVTGQDVLLEVPLQEVRPADPVFSRPRVEPYASSGLGFVAVGTHAVGAAGDPPLSRGTNGPQFVELKLSGSRTLLLQFRLDGREGQLRGLRFNWAEGEPSYTQTLPLDLTATAGGCEFR